MQGGALKGDGGRGGGVSGAVDGGWQSGSERLLSVSNAVGVGSGERGESGGG